MRSKRALLNIIIALIYEMFLIVMGIVIPKLIIGAYGSDVNGLTSTINNVLAILNLIQAGAVGASIFQMFKPVAEKDYETQGKILASSRKYFNKIGFIFLSLVLISAPVLSLAMTSGSIGFWDKIIAFLLLGVNGSLSFFFVSNYDILFSSNQKRFLLSLGGLFDKIIYYALIILIIIFKFNYLSMYFVTIVGTFTKIVFLYIVYNIYYKKLIKYTYCKDYKIPNKGYLMLNQIARQTIDGAPTIVISMVGGLGLASVYSIYNLVFNMIKTLSTTIQTSISEIFGNVIVTDSKDRVKNIYDLLNFLFFAMSIVLCGCAAFLFRAFIFVYTDGNNLDINYMYDLLTLLFTIYGVLFINYHPIYTLTNVLGFYKDTYLQSVITAVVSIIILIVLSFVDWPLTAIGPIFYFIVSYIYRTYIVFKKTGRSYIFIGKTISRLIVSFLIAVGAWFISFFMFNDFKCSWMWWLTIAILTGLASLLVLGIYSILFEKENMASLISYVKTTMKRRNK